MAIVPRIFHVKEYDIADEYESEWGKGYALEVDRLKMEREEEFGAALEAKSMSSSLGRSAVMHGLLYGILVDNGHCAKYFKTLGRIMREQYGEIVTLLKKLMKERFHRFLEPVKVQLVWMVSSMIQLGVEEVDGLVMELIRQVPAGQSGQTSSIWLWSELLTLFSSFRSWLYSHPALLPTVAYAIASLIPDHHRSEFDALREREIALLVLLVRERFDAVRTGGRDFIRALYNISLIPDIKIIWDQVILAPIDASTRDSNLKQLLATPSPRHLLISRITPEIESWLTFVFTQVKAGPHSWYQKWFQSKFLSSPDCEPLVADLIRWIVSVHHPTNSVLQSNILPRYKFIGWLIGACTRNPHFQNTARQALYYDWYFYQTGKDNIMSIEPGALLLMNTLQKDPIFVGALAEHIMVACDNYLVKDLPSLREDMRKSVHQASRLMIEKKVISSFEPLYTFSHLHQSLRDQLKKVFEGVASKSSQHAGQNTSSSQKPAYPGSNASASSSSTASSQSSRHMELTSSGSSTGPNGSGSANSTPNITPTSSIEIPVPTLTHKSQNGASSSGNGSGKDSTSNIPDTSLYPGSASASSSSASPHSSSVRGGVSSSAAPSASVLNDSKKGISSPLGSEAGKGDEFGSVFAGWKAALTSSASHSEGSSNSAVNERSNSPMSSSLSGQQQVSGASDLQSSPSASPRGSISLPGGAVQASAAPSSVSMDIRLSHEIIISSTPSTKYLEHILLLSKRVEAGNMRLAKNALETFVASAASDWALSPFSSSDMLDLATKLLEILAPELIEQWHGEQQRKLALPSPADFVHTQLFQTFVEREGESASEGEKAFSLALMQAVRVKEGSFGSRFLCFLFATFQPSSTVDMTSINADANQDELFLALMQSEEEKSSLELREAESLATPPWITPYLDFLAKVSESSGKTSQEVFLEDMTQLALANVASFNSVVPLVCRYLPDHCLGNSPFVHLVLRTCLPQSMTALHGALSSQTFRLVGPNLTGILHDSLKWETYAQQLLWNMLTSEFLTQTDLLIEALATLLPKFQTSTASEAMQGSLTLISLIGPVPKLIQAVLSMNLNSYEFTNSIWVRWMVEDEFQTELAKKLPTILNGFSKNVPSLRRAVMHLALIYAAIPSDMDLLLEHGPLRRALLTHFKSTCTDSAFNTLKNECLLKDDKEKATETKRGSKKRIHEEDPTDDTEDAKVPSPPPPAAPKTAPPKAKRRKAE